MLEHLTVGLWLAREIVDGEVGWIKKWTFGKNIIEDEKLKLMERLK